MKILKPHQKDALTYLSSRFHGALFLDMRLGKNLCIIRHLSKHNITKVLYVTEFGAMRSIELELKSEGIECHVLTGTRQKRLNALRCATNGWVISNYESANKLNIHRESWQAVVLDETIKIASPKAGATKFFMAQFRDVKMRFILNGLPSPEGYHQLVTQFIYLHGHFFGCKTYWQWRARYMVKETKTRKDGQSYPEWTIPDLHKQEIKKYVHKHAFCLTRKQAGVGSEKIYETRIVPQTPEQRKLERELIKNYALGDVEYVNDLGLQIGLSYLAGGVHPDEGHAQISLAKYKELYKLIMEVEDDKILVWCRFRAEQEYICKMLEAMNMCFIYINGSLSKSDRDEAKEAFELSCHKAVAVLTIKSCAKGQDWAVADTSIYFSNEWSCDKRSQSEDRLVHLNKTEPVLVIDLITENSVDEDVHSALKDKQLNAKDLMTKYTSRFK